MVSNDHQIVDDISSQFDEIQVHQETMMSESFPIGVQFVSDSIIIKVDGTFFFPLLVQEVKLM